MRLIKLFLVVFYFVVLMVFQNVEAVEKPKNLEKKTEKGGCEINNVIVYQEDGKFCGWPANEGIWSWGDEILVGFEVASFTRNEKGHSIDRNSPKHIYFARSSDGGQT